MYATTPTVETPQQSAQQPNSVPDGYVEIGDIGELWGERNKAVREEIKHRNAILECSRSGC